MHMYSVYSCSFSSLALWGSDHLPVEPPLIQDADSAITNPGDQQETLPVDHAKHQDLCHSSDLSGFTTVEE